MTTTSSGPSRRTLVKGTAWTVPVVAVAGAAPAMAASPEIIHSHITQWRWYSNSAPWCGSNRRDGLEINTTDTSAFVRFTDTRSWTTITDVYADFWFTRNDITWSAATGDSGCWSVPTRIAAGNATWTSGNRTYYAYRSSYSCTITPVNLGTTVLSSYRWRSQCYNIGDNTWQNARWVRRTAYATVNGVAQPLDTGAFEIDS